MTPDDLIRPMRSLMLLPLHLFHRFGRRFKATTAAIHSRNQRSDRGKPPSRFRRRL